MKIIKLPSIIDFMITGAVFSPALLSSSLLNEDIREHCSGILHFAGANLHSSVLLSLGLTGIIYSRPEVQVLFPALFFC
jgi:hypothetical protein